MSELNQPHFQDADEARKYLEAQVWPNGRICPHCGSIGAHYELRGKTNRPGLYKCSHCREPFTVTVGTVFERSKIGLHIWLQAIYLISSSKKGISSKQVERMLGVTYKTAWFMTHRIREAMKSPGGLLGSDGGPVEIDETFIGRKPGRRAKGGYAHKHAVFSLVDRQGNARSFHVPNVKAETLKPILLQQVSPEAIVYTDTAGQYRKIQLGKSFKAHESVNHLMGEYARGNVHTNTVESFFGILKRGINGTFHHVSEQHLQRYVTEFDFRFSHRERRVKGTNGKWEMVGFTDSQRADALMRGIKGKRLTYRRTHGAA